MRYIHVDGGAFVEPPTYHFHDAYFSVVDGETGELIHFEKNIGDRWSGEAEYEAIKWAVLNISERPLTIYSDCTVAISWATRKKPKGIARNCHPLNLQGITLTWLHGNLADKWNADNHSPKVSRGEYYKRWLKLR